MKTASKTGLSATLAYDAEGRLRQTAIGSTTINLLNDAERLVAEYDAAGTTVLRKYVHGPGTDEPIVWYEGAGTTAKNWLYADHLGSVVATANGTGASTATYSYGPYGEPNVATGLRFRYTGQQLIGELGLYYYKARFYSPQLGRFLQTDPIGYKDDQNLYAYVGNNAANRTDPTGLAGVSTNSGQVSTTSGRGQSGQSIFSSASSGADFSWIGGGGNAPTTSESYEVAWLQPMDMLNQRNRSLLEGGGGGGGGGGAGGGTSYYRGAAEGQTPSFVPRSGEYRVDSQTGTVRDTHGVSVFNNPASVSSRGLVPNRVDQTTMPDSLRIIQRGNDPNHFEIVPRPGVNLTPQQYIDACSRIGCSP